MAFHGTKNKFIPLIAQHGIWHPDPLTNEQKDEFAKCGYATINGKKIKDVGYFGRGAYYTTKLSYANFYASKEKEVPIVLCCLALGKVFPVQEHPRSKEDSMMGADLKDGYNSHFSIIDTKEGFYVYSNENSISLQDEIVTFNKAQALPIAFVYARKATTIDTSPQVKIEEKEDEETGDIQQVATISFKFDDPGNDYCLMWIDPNHEENNKKYIYSIENKIKNKKIKVIKLICLDHLRVYIQKYESKLKKMLENGKLRVVSNGYRQIDGGIDAAFNTSSFFDTHPTMDKIELLFFCGRKTEGQIGGVMNIAKRVFVTSNEQYAFHFMTFKDADTLVKALLKDKKEKETILQTVCKCARGTFYMTRHVSLRLDLTTNQYLIREYDDKNCTRCEIIVPTIVNLLVDKSNKTLLQIITADITLWLKFKSASERDQWYQAIKDLM